MTATGMPVDARPAALLPCHECPVSVPYRLDLAVSALRRLSTNVVDVLTLDGQYVRALVGSCEPLIARVAQVRLEALALVHRMLGVDRDLTHFDRTAESIPWLKPLAAPMRGAKPPRYATLWEAFVNVIVFQQISLPAGSAIMECLIVALGRPIDSYGVRSYLFATVESVLDAKDDLLRAVGLSPGKLLSASGRGAT